MTRAYLLVYMIMSICLCVPACTSYVFLSLVDVIIDSFLSGPKKFYQF